MLIELGVHFIYQWKPMGISLKGFKGASIYLLHKRKTCPLFGQNGIDDTIRNAVIGKSIIIIMLLKYIQIWL